jgi:succinyl-CoA synthetase beta subunit
MVIIESSRAKGLSSLSEYQSKRFLSSFGIPVTRESLVQSREEAVEAAEEIGYPVVLKASSPELMHKSERGGIEIYLRREQDVQEAYDRIVQAFDIELEGMIVQEMVRGQREIVMGLIRDPQFGPCIMLGLGGVLTELLKDTVFRVAPIDIQEAKEMTQDLRSKAIFDAFRGQEPADLEGLCRSLVALGEIGLNCAQVSEIDINPMIIDPLGRVVAADALVVLKPQDG